MSDPQNFDDDCATLAIAYVMREDQKLQTDRGAAVARCF
jgi:hypothetical protein